MSGDFSFAWLLCVAKAGRGVVRKSMGGMVAWLDKTFYAAFSKNWDDQMLRDRILRQVSPESRVLDFGAGRGYVEAMNFRSAVQWVAGVDVDPVVRMNPYLHQAAVLEPPAFDIPFPDGSFDLVFADNVLEHLERPGDVLKEIARVLKPGGAFIAKTPGKWHYMPIVARITPIAFHRFYNRLRGRREVDTFPTVYRCNSPGAARQCAAVAGLVVDEIEHVEGRPEYLRLSWATYLVGIAYERIVNSAGVLAPIRSVMMIRMSKPRSRAA